MADVKKPSIASSVSYKIGGKEYSAKDVSQFKSSQTGNVKTGTDIAHESAGKVQSQTSDFYKKDSGLIKSGIENEVQNTPRTVESIKTNAETQTPQSTPYRSQVQTQQPQSRTSTERVSPSVSSPTPPQNTTGNVKTQSSISREAEQKVQSQTDSYHKSGAYNTPQPTIRDRVDSTPMNLSGVQTGISRTPQTSHFSLFNVVNSTNGKSFNLENAINKVGGKAQSALSQQADLGAESAGMGVSAGLVGVQAFRASQKFTEAAPAMAKSTAHGLYSAGKGVYQVAVTGGLAVVTVSRTAAMVSAGQFHPLSHASMQMLKAQALAVGLNKTALSQGIIHSVTGIHNRIQSGVQTAKHIGSTIQTGYHTVQRGIKIVRGVTNGTISATVAANAVSRMANRAVKFSVGGIKTGVSVGLKTGKGLIVKGVTKGIPFVALKGVPKTVSFLRGGGLTLAGVMQGSDDWAIRGTGTAIKVTDIGVRTAIKGAKATGYTVKTAVKGGMATGRATLAAGRFIKNQGLKAAWNAGRKKAATAIANAGKSMVTAMINAVKALRSKIIIPLLIVVLVIMGFNGIVMVPVTAVSSIFSSMFSTRDSHMDYDVSEYLNTIVPG